MTQKGDDNPLDGDGVFSIRRSWGDDELRARHSRMAELMRRSLLNDDPYSEVPTASWQHHHEQMP